MKIKVTLYVAGKVFDETVEARDYQSAKQTALARNQLPKYLVFSCLMHYTTTISKSIQT